LTATRIGGTLVNLPPATVYRIAQRRVEPCAFQTKHEPAESKRFEHPATPSLINAAGWPAPFKECFHGIRNFLKQQQRAIFRGE
jgi:hypothetical protein